MAATPAKKAASKRAAPAKKASTKKLAPAKQAATTKKAVATTKAAAAKKPAPAKKAVARSSVAAGAERAGGERAKRRSTPLLTASQADSAPSTSTSTSTPTSRASTPRSSKHRPSPKATPQASRKQRSQSGERASAPVSRIAQRAASAAKAATPAPERGEKPANGIPARRVPRTSPRARRAADEKARATLRVAPEPAETTTPARSRSLDPTLTPPATKASSRLPAPGAEDVLKGVIGALRMASEAAGVAPEDIESRIAQLLAYLRRRIEGNYSVDEFGYDGDYFENLVLPMLRPLYRKWFRVEVRGIENIPDDGGALIVANHSGTVAIDSLMVQVAIHDEHRKKRVMRSLGADLVFQTPLLGTFARRAGSTLATAADADRLFAQGELVGVFPEGFKGVGKPFTERYKLQRFGRGGFVSAALKAEVPIIPCSIVGAEEIAPIIGNLPTLARLLGMPYLPITPTFPWLGPLGMIPLPSKWIIEFGTPIRTDTYGSAASEDPMLVFDLTDQVRETIQQTLYALLMQRRSVFF